MSMTKFAKAEVLDVKGSHQRTREASLERISDFHDYRTDDGYMYVRIRAISSRTNKNNDGWPTVELAGGPESWERYTSNKTSGEGFTIEASKDEKYGFSTFVGKPIFVDHNNHDPKRARGVIVDSKFHVLDGKTSAEDDYWNGQDADPEHLPPSEVELLLEVDADSFPKLAKSIASGDLDGFSMGCDVEYSKCSHCGHEASSPDEYCTHIKMKGKNFTHTADDGTTKSRKSYENCYGIKFFEISAVFDPADPTALAREVIDEQPVTAATKTANPIVCPLCSGGGCPQCGGTGQVEAGTGTDGAFMLKGDQNYVGFPNDRGTYNSPYSEGPSIRYNDGSLAAPNLTLDPRDMMNQFRTLGPRHQGGVTKTAEPDLPQSMHTTAPEDVDTLRQEKICPICGSDIDGDKCDVCGYESPPESMQNPDLEKAKGEELGEEEPLQEGATPPENLGEQVEEQRQPGSLLTNNPQPTSSVKSDMRSWTPSIYGGTIVNPIITRDANGVVTAASKGDEPEQETVTSDQPKPVTATFRTAKELIAAAKGNPTGEQMSEHEKVAAEPVPAAKPDKRVDVEGVGSVTQGTNEEASKPEGAHSWEPKGVTVDVEGKGGVLEDSNAEASKPSDGTQSVEQTSDNAGFQPGGQKGPNTKTFPNSNEPGSAVTQKAFPTSSEKDAAKQGVKPLQPGGPFDVQADARVNVEDDEFFGNKGTPTDQWTGTDGNGVTRQQNPVTNVPTQSGGIKSSVGMVSIAALRQADTEVELGLIDKDKKYDRLVELSKLSPQELAAEERVTARVKTAGLGKQASTPKVATRVPSFRKAQVEDANQATPITEADFDAGIFLR